MKQEDPASASKNPNRLLITAIVGVLTIFFGFPLLILFYGGLAAAISGWLILGSGALLQIPIFRLLKRFGLLPVVERSPTVTQKNDLS